MLHINIHNDIFYLKTSFSPRLTLDIKRAMSAENSKIGTRLIETLAELVGRRRDLRVDPSDGYHERRHRLAGELGCETFLYRVSYKLLMQTTTLRFATWALLKMHSSRP